jgi:Protein kinase domain
MAVATRCYRLPVALDENPMDEMTRRLADTFADRYRIDRELGAGGMAVVYLAHDPRHGRQVAIKVMRPELSGSLGVDRFLREVQLLAKLQHPHILGLVDSGVADGLLYYVAPYLEGGSLRERLDHERDLPVADALAILREVADALAHAHAQGVVHRDIKPENVLFSAGHVQLADFGIARIVDEVRGAAALTSSGMVIGSPQYMAPEQAAGDSKTDHRADVYGFGVLAYEMLAGVPPFVASSAPEIMALHMTEEPIALSKRRPAVPAALDELVMRCLRKRPADRWQTARDLRTRLEHVAVDGATRENRGGTTAARLPITETIARRFERKHFDPRMIGDSIEYLDNLVQSDVLVLLVNAAWLDASDFEPHLRMLPYRCVAPTLYGFEPLAQHRFELSIEDHGVLLGELMRKLIEESSPSLVIAVGYSASGDIILRLAATPRDGVRVPDGVLSFGCNQALETCFVSRVLARLDGNDPDQLLRALREIGDAATSLDDWLLTNAYLGRIMAKFRTEVGPMSKLASEIVAPFQRDNAGAFAAMYREATARVKNVRCVFEDSETCNRLLRNVLLEHMDRGVLGEHHRDGALLIESTKSHFEIVQPERVAKHLAAMVGELRAARS